MKSIAAQVLLLLMVPTVAASQTTELQSGDERQLERLTRDWVAATQAGDAATLNRLLDESFTFISPRGRLLPKATYLANRTPGTATMDSLRSQIEDIKIHVYGNAGVVTSRLITSGRASDGDFSGEYRRRDVWVKRGGVWRAVSNQLAPINYTGAHSRAAGSAITSVAPADLDWTVSASSAGMNIAALHGTEYLGPYVVRVRRASGHLDLPHRHESDEHITVLSGMLALGSGEGADSARLTTLAAGTYAIIPAGTPHYSWARGETIYQSWWAGPAGPTYVEGAAAMPGPAPAKASAAQSAKPEQQIRALELERRDAILRNDTLALERLLAAGLSTVTAGGTLVTKAEEIAVNKSADRKVLSWDFEELDIRVYGDAAVSTMRARFSDVVRGRTRTEHQRLTHVWAKIGDHWQLVSRQATRINNPAAGPTDSTVILNGVRLHYLEWQNANAPVLLLLPGTGGGGGSVQQWASFAKSMNGAYHVLALEPRGCGESEWADEYSWESILGDVDAFLTHRGVERVVLVGHSMSARWAALYAAQHPTKVERLILVDSDVLASLEPLPDPQRTFAEPSDAIAFARARWGTHPAVDDVVRDWIERGVRRLENGEWTWRVDPQLREGLRQSLPTGERLRAMLRRISSPTLVVRGTLPAAVNRERAQLLAQAIPDARLAEVSESGHVVHLANPEGFLDVVRTFLDSTINHKR
ncbi:MAG: alpha/beta fold hydrolase [Gemmatimonadota bacterium]